MVEELYPNHPAFVGEPITEEIMSYLWKQINKIHPSAFDGWFGMGVDEWTEFGVTKDDSPEEAYQKVKNGIDTKLSTKAYGWYMCECGAIDCSFIWPQLSQIPDTIKDPNYPNQWNCTAHPKPDGFIQVRT